MKRILLVTLLLLILIVYAQKGNNSLAIDGPVKGVEINNALPVCREGNDNPFSLYLLRGRFDIVSFRISRNIPCLTKKAVLISVYNKFKGEGFHTPGAPLNSNINIVKNSLSAHGQAWSSCFSILYGSKNSGRNWEGNINDLEIGNNLKKGYFNNIAEWECNDAVRK